MKSTTTRKASCGPALLMALLGTLVWSAPAHSASSPLGIAIRPTSQLIELGQDVSIEVRLIGPFDPSQPLRLMVAPVGSPHYTNTWSAIPSSDGTAEIPVYIRSNWPSRGGLNAPKSNFRAYVTDGSARSPRVLVYVVPLINLGLTRSDTPTSIEDGPKVKAMFSADVHPMRRYPRPLVYFYDRRAGSREYRLVGERRLRPTSRSYFGEYLTASVEYYDPSAGTAIACSPHQIVKDMGRPFFDRRCGQKLTTHFP